VSQKSKSLGVVKCGPIFIFFITDSQENSLYIDRKDFRLTCSMSLHYLVKFENPKKLPNFHVECDNV